MKNDASDTFPEAEHTRWQETTAEDVFLPSVRVQLRWGDVEAAVAQGAIVPQQAHALWASWAMPGSSTRLSGQAPEGQHASSEQADASKLESAWVKPMPEIQRPSRAPFYAGLALGAVVVLGAVTILGNPLAG